MHVALRPATHAGIYHLSSKEYGCHVQGCKSMHGNEEQVTAAVAFPIPHAAT